MQNSSEKILDKLIDISQTREQGQFSPQEVVSTLVSLLSERENRILTSRYGFNGQQPKTLDAIGKDLNLTRERIRQVEKQALKNIIRHNKYDELVSPFGQKVKHVLKEHGGLMSEEYLIQKLKSLTQGQESVEQFIKFLLANFMTDIVLVKDANFKSSWSDLESSTDWINEILNQLEKIFAQYNRILEQHEVIKLFEKSAYYQDQTKELAEILAKNNWQLDRILFSYLDASHKFTMTPFNQWGLADWPSVNPRRINGKIYLVMLAQKKPLHFTKIAELINTGWSDARDIQTATVHNELIFDPRFVLVGRGVYGLKDWGYADGSVEQVVGNILKKSGQPLSQDEIIEKVKAKKIVKDATIKLVLKSKDKFVKDEEGKYKLKD